MTPSNLEDQIIKAKDRHGCHIFGVNLKTWAFIHTYSLNYFGQGGDTFPTYLLHAQLETLY
jgi:hypothetical protein